MGSKEDRKSSMSKELVKYQYDFDIMSLEWWQKNVMYHVYLPSFKDSNNDGIGDILGLLSQLDYFEDLKIKTLLLSPFYLSPKKDNGYDISSYVEIDPIYGTMDDFDELMKEIEKRDMHVIVDLVPNHTSDQHVWFQKSIEREEPYSDFYIWVDAKPGSTETQLIPPNNWLSVFGGPAWTWNERRQQFYFRQFLSEQPDLNLRNPLVVEEIKKVVAFWLEKGVDGFRVDAASHLFEDELLRDEPVDAESKAKNNEHGYLEHIYTKGLKENQFFLKELRTVLDEYEKKTKKTKVLVAEVFEEIEDIMRYYGSVGDKAATFPFNFQLYKLKADCTGIDLFEKVDLWLKNMPKGKYPNWVVSSHDDHRVITRLGRRLASSIQMLIMVLPGVPICYYGDEIGMDNAKIKEEDIRDSFALRTCPENSRDPMRTPMQWNATKNAGFTDCDKPWLPVNENYKTINVEAEKEDPLSFLSIFKHLSNLRKEASILVGLIEFPVVNEDIFSCVRFLVGAKCFLFVSNLSWRTICINMSNTSQFLPSEGFLEVSSGHFHQEISESKESSKATSDVHSCTCHVEQHPSTSSESRQVKISLERIHLKSKEAVVISFTGGEK